MKKINFLLLLLLMLSSCWVDKTSSEVIRASVKKDNRITTCETIATKTQERLVLANTNPDIKLDFLGIETILWDVSSCFLKVKISNPNDAEKPDIYSLFDVVREKTTSNHTSLEEIENQIQSIRDTSSENNTPETMKTEQMLIVLAAPSKDNTYYEERFDDIVNFQINYVKTVAEAWSDEIRILVDNSSRPVYEEKLEEKYLISADMYDIWMRDFTTVNPEKPVQFYYTDASMSKNASIRTQQMFWDFATEYELEIEKAQYLIDGWNIVDNYDGKIITTTRFLKDNFLSYDKWVEVLKEVLWATHVAILEPDDEVLAHADGMVAWIDDNVLAVNDYSAEDPEFHKIMIEELEYAFPDTKIVTVPVEFDENGGIDTTKGIGSACWVNLNLVSTYSTLYVPTFGNNYEQEVLDIIKKNTSKEVIAIDAQGVCKFWGSVRCTAWQLAGENMNKLLNK